MVRALTNQAARFALVAVAGVLLTACGTARISSEQATRVAVDAFVAAGLDPVVKNVVEDATVDRAGDGAFIQVHQVDIEVDGIVYEVGVSRTDGAVVRLTEARRGLSDAEVETIASYRDNPAEDDARGRRTLVWLCVLAIGSLAAYALVRRARLAVERGGVAEEIPLD